MVRVVASGGFDPLHIGHLEYLTWAKALGDKLIVILNNDDFLFRKKGYALMPLHDRMRIIEALRVVDEVVASIDKDDSVIETLKRIKPDIVANGGDRTATESELELSKELGFQMIWGLGNKIRSSKEIVNGMVKQI